MNYLAHFHLARAHDDWLVGALLGDYVKGPLRGVYPQCWEEGIRLHRKIDALSDSHPLRAHLAAALPPEFRRYAGIVLDVCCDHWLSRHWQQLSVQPLPAFAGRVYDVMDRHARDFPDAPQRLAARLREYDMLCGYENWEAVPATLRRIGTRLPRANPLTHADSGQLTAAMGLANEFPRFYAELTANLQRTGFAISS